MQRSSRRVKNNPPVVDISSDSDSSAGKRKKTEDSDSEDDYKPIKNTARLKNVKRRKPLDSDSEDNFESTGKTARVTKRIAANKAHGTAPFKKDEEMSKTKGKNSTQKQASKRTRKVEELDSLEAAPVKKQKSLKVSKDRRGQDDDPNIEAVPGSSSQEAKKTLQMIWNETDYLAEAEAIDRNVASAIIRLFDEDNTIPFIARYRKEMTGNMTPEKLCQVKDCYESIKNIKHRAASVIKSIEKAGKLTPQLEHRIMCARDLHELDHIYAPFKPGTKRELAAKARMLGLEPAAIILLEGTEEIRAEQLVDINKKGCETVAEVQKGIQHIIADIISKDTDVLAEIRNLLKSKQIQVESKKAATRSKTKDLEKTSKSSSADAGSKFSDYFQFSISLRCINPHQVLALNRGEKLKELSVRIVIPDYVEREIARFCQNKWFRRGIMYPFRKTVLTDSVKDSYTRLITPLITRRVRSEMNEDAAKESIQVFSRNLKSLLLTPPHKGHSVLAIDPGFRHGCKTALVSATGTLLEYCVLYLTSNNSKQEYQLKEIMMKHKCELIAIGNGQACRETEEYISSLINRNFFRPLNVEYTIIDEQGVSIYSCSEEANKEFPNLDPTVRSAISIARRLQDPLSEMVKVEPKHLGVGMYQHDLPEKVLSAALQEVVTECVSFVGVDLNTAPHCLLKQIAGIGDMRASRILEWKETNGSFYTREQLLEVKGIGKKSFEQCAGFVRILPDTVKDSERWKLCPLDRTWIHPESYSFVEKFAGDNGIDLSDLGSSLFRRSVEDVVAKAGGAQGIAHQYGVTETLVDFVVKGLVVLNQDFRLERTKPIFRKGITTMADLKEGAQLTGRVTNTVTFGAFVDIGVGQNGLIHISAMKGQALSLGDRVEVLVKNIDAARKRIGLILVQKL